jgi:hypothetical protein
MREICQMFALSSLRNNFSLPYECELSRDLPLRTYSGASSLNITRCFCHPGRALLPITLERILHSSVFTSFRARF